jgi:hypothetical protein
MEQMYCPHCGREVQVPPDLFGSLVRCPLCRGEFVAPEFASSFSRRESPREEPSVESQPGPSRSGGEFPGAPTEGSPLACPWCGARGPHRTVSETSLIGWVVFVVLIFTCLPLCWIGLLIQEPKRYCRTCYARLP